MLHSDDADINKVIREIIDLDSKAVRIKQNVTARAETIVTRTKAQVKEHEKTELEQAHLIADQNYQSQIESARQERESIVNEMKEEIKRLHESYDEKKDEKAVEVLEKLFNISLSSEL
ncbi:hypothetical protein Q5O24_10070 [Eubacteriaceae bacterium ES3]|nr:hypothetical protein Q5O24_10070 [Eubacteriaceae bacterium ES3]